jgi:tRNA threonylcarbamoyladenosine biosynthesis protein TsaB
VTDARQGLVYAALFACGGAAGLERLRPDAACAPGDVADWVDGPTVFCGDGALRHRALFAECLGDRFVMAPPWRMLASAEEVAALAWPRWLAGDTDDPATLEPEYVRRSYTQAVVGPG